MKRWIPQMIPRWHIVLHSVLVLTIVPVIFIALSGGSHGTIPTYYVMILVTVCGVAIWSILFSLATLVMVVRSKCWRVLAFAISLLVLRLVFFFELLVPSTEAFWYLWFPFEYIAFYLIGSPDAKQTKTSFAVVTAALFVVCFLVCTAPFWLRYLGGMV